MIARKITTTALAAALITVGPVAPAEAAHVTYVGGTGTSATKPISKQVIAKWVAPLVVAEPHEASQVLYNASPWDRPQAAAPALQRHIASTDGTTTVVGLSKGAQVIHAAIQGYNTDPNAPAPGKVRFVLVGDPDNDGGITRKFFLSTPHETRYDVEIITAQYDGYADFPDRPNIVSILNALAGIAFVHPMYGQGGDLDPFNHLDEAQVTVKDNLDATGKPNGTTTTTKVIPTKHLPLTMPIRMIAPPVADALDKVLRPVVDAGYSRGPVKPTKPKVESITKDGNKFSPGDTVTEKAKDDDAESEAKDGNKVEPETVADDSDESPASQPEPTAEAPEDDAEEAA